jgi:hypothetical protein
LEKKNGIFLEFFLGGFFLDFFCENAERIGSKQNVDPAGKKILKKILKKVFVRLN